MHILHVLDHSVPLHSGYSFRTRSIVQAQRAMGWQTSHITGAKQGSVSAACESVDGLDFFRTPVLNGMLAQLPLVNQWAVIAGLCKRLRQLVTQLKPDVLHAHSPALNGVAALKISRQFNIPLVYEVRAFWEDAAVDLHTSKAWGMRYRLTRALETYVLRRADAVTTICEGLRAEMIGRGIAANKITIIPNAVNLEQFDRRGSVKQNNLLRRQLGLENTSVLGFIGSFYAYEGLALLVQALPRILLKEPHTRLLLVGGGNEYAALQALTEKLELREQVVFTGRVAHEQVNDYYELVDIFVYPRLAMRLTNLVTPLKPLEAMASGRLVLASDVGGHKELIRDGQTGSLFRAGQVDALAAAAIDLLRHRERWPERRVEARRFVEHERQWQPVVQRYQAVYERITVKTSQHSAALG